jgi:excisionase family DNA binding protein
MAVKTIEPEALERITDTLEQIERASQALKEEQTTGKRRPTLTIGDEEIPLSDRLASELLDIVSTVARGHAVSFGTADEELTTTEAADLLNVSRPHLVTLLKQGKLPFHRVGSHRRVYLHDVLKYKAKRRRESEEAMQALADQAQELDLGY